MKAQRLQGWMTNVLCAGLGLVFCGGLCTQPADAALVYTRDGRVFDGTLKVEPKGLVLVTAEKRALMIPYDQVVGISLDGQPIFPAPRRAEDSKLFNHEGVVWTLVATQVIAAVSAIVLLLRPAPATGAAPTR